MKTKKIKASQFKEQMHQRIVATFGQEFLNEWIKDNATFYLYNRDDWYAYAQIEGDYSIVKERIETKNKMILQSGILKSN